MALSRRNIRNVIVCDDIRREDNGKLILIGVYSDQILIDSFPAVLTFTIYCEIMPDSLEPIILNARVYFGKKSKTNVPLQMRLDIILNKLGVIPVVLPKTSFSATQEGTYHVDISFEGSKWVTLVEKSIDLSRNPIPSIVSTQPVLQSDSGVQGS